MTAHDEAYHAQRTAAALAPILRGSEPGFTEWAACMVPITYNSALAPTFEWCASEDGQTAQFRLVDGFGSVVFGVSIAWPFGPTHYDETGRIELDER